MQRKLAFAAAAATAAVVAGLFALPGVAANGPVNSTTGAGQLDLAGGFRNFSYTAKTAADGTVSGEAQLVNRASGLRWHIAVNCLVVSGNHAWVGGVVDSANDPTAVGTVGVWYAEDNGEGSTAPPDRMSLFTFFSPVLTCTDPFAQAYTLANALPIDGGNIQVH